MRKGSKRPKPTHKSILITDVKEKLLASQELMGSVADKAIKEVATLKKQLEDDSPILTGAISVKIIKQVLGISPEVDITQIVPVGKKLPHNG